jgi:aspartate/tyrosine/aromatic aminotransferase
VKKVEAEMLKEDLNKEYLSMEGDPEFVKCSRELIFGTDIPNMERICTLQALSGTGSLRVAGAFLKEYMPADTAVYFSDPTWGNHYRIFNHAGLTKHVKYPYYKASNNSLNIEGMLECLREAPRGSIILLHPCAHNPTGIDPTKDQWKMILQVIKEKELFTFFDSAYQGYATGDLEDDAYAIRLFAKEGAQFVLCQSYAKNAGLYGERIGAVHFGCANKETCAKVFSQAK